MFEFQRNHAVVSLFNLILGLAHDLHSMLVLLRNQLLVLLPYPPNFLFHKRQVLRELCLVSRICLKFRQPLAQRLFLFQQCQLVFLRLLNLHIQHPAVVLRRCTSSNRSSCALIGWCCRWVLLVCSLLFDDSVHLLAENSELVPQQVVLNG